MPVTRPAIGTTCADPPTPAGGIVVNWIDGSALAVAFRHPAELAPSASSATNPTSRVEAGIVTPKNNPFE